MVAPPPATLTQPVAYDLSRLHAAAPIVLTAAHPRSPDIRFRIGRRAHRRWPYARVAFRFTVDLDPRSAAGEGYVNMKTETGSDATAQFRTRRHALTRWETVNFSGQTSHRTERTHIPVAMTNYVLFHDARAGEHRLHFDLEAFRGLRFRRVTVSPSSSIRLTAQPPGGQTLDVAGLSLSAREHGVRAARVGRPFRIGVRIRNASDLWARANRVRTSADPGLRVVGRGIFRGWGAVAPGRVVERELVVVPTRAGPHRVVLSLRSSIGSDAGVVRLTSRAAASDGGSGRHDVLKYGVLVLVGVLASAGALRVTRRRRR